MADNKNLDTFVAGQTLTDVGGTTTTGLDVFVAGVLYETMESSGPADAFTGEAGGALLATTVAALRSSQFEAGGALLANTFAISARTTVLQAGGGASHTVTIKGSISAVTDQAGGALRAVTIKYVVGDVIPGGLMLLGVGS